jgi:pyruvate/2-oxoglutarate dehydrogenase complex dihydrolipoamide acyltransferase (E2) component
MPSDILMPVVAEDVEEGVLVAWFVEPGDLVEEGRLVAEVQVEKVASEVHAPAAGRIARLLVDQGGTARQGAPIAVLEPAEAGAAPRAGRVTASPAARRLARELGVDMAALEGSGPGGRVLESDVRQAAAAEPGQVAAVEPLSPLRRTIAERLHAGVASTAQVTLTAEADTTRLEGRLRELTAAWGRRASYTDAAVRACALALRQHPRMAARWHADGLIPARDLDIGVAVATEGGLLVPVVRAADTKDLPTLSGEIADLARRAAEGTLQAGETSGGVFSVTNLGAWGIDAFTPLLDPPQTGILGVGEARPRPAVVDGQVVVRVRAVLSLTFDHRVIDGAPAAAFLASVVALLADPGALTAAD